MRYTGQGYELRVSLAGLKAPLTRDALQQARKRFDEQHARLHFHAASDRPVEIVSYRLRVRVAAPKYVPERAPAKRARAAPESAVKGSRAVRFDAARETRTRIFERDRLSPGARIEGPAIVEQFDATTVIPPGWRATVDEFLNLVLERRNDG